MLVCIKLKYYKNLISVREVLICLVSSILGPSKKCDLVTNDRFISA